MMVSGMGRTFNAINRSYKPRNAFRSRSGRKSTVPSGPPKSFTTFRDPQGRFVLDYPADWKLRTGDGIQVTSARLGSFARVDILPDCPRFWENLKEQLIRAGGSVRFRTRNGSRPVHVRGKIHVGRTDFDWDAYAYRLGKTRVVLSLGNVVDPGRSAAIERYEDGVLASIRRHFLVRNA